MPLFICRWQNGDFSAVYAHNKEDAILKLDEVGDAELGELFTVKNFMVHFKLKENLPEDVEELLPIDLEGFGEETADDLSERVYPIYHRAVMTFDDNWSDRDHATEEQWELAEKELKEALITERRRNWGAKQPQLSTDPEAARLQEIGHNIPKALAERVVKERRRKQLEDFNIKPGSDKLQ
jgi:ATP-dependent exoDNAse (exonuclease V) alpha subunit